MILSKVAGLALVALRAAALGLRLQGQGAAADTLLLIADAAQSGKNIDDHMREVADKLAAGEAIDWEDVQARIRAASADLHSQPTG